MFSFSNCGLFYACKMQSCYGYVLTRNQNDVINVCDWLKYSIFSNTNFWPCPVVSGFERLLLFQPYYMGMGTVGAGNPSVWLGVFSYGHHNQTYSSLHMLVLRARFKRPTWGLPGADRTRVGPMLATWTLLSGVLCNGTDRIGVNMQSVWFYWANCCCKKTW